MTPFANNVSLDRMEQNHSNRAVQLLIAVLFAVVVPALVAVFVPKVRIIPSLFSFDEGVWRTELLPMERATFPELKAPVDVAFDNNGIPHVVAQNDDDLYFAQGVLSAHYRLFQMEITARAGMGEISEMLGPRAAMYDRFFVTFGMRDAVRAEAAELLKDPHTGQVIQAYARGVNAYIQQLSQANLPVEYKLTGAWPRRWTRESVASLLKIMTFRLAGRSNDLRLTKILKAVGREKTSELFPEFMPDGLEEFFINFTPAKMARHDYGWKYDFVTQFTNFPTFLSPVETNGSNSWAVGPDKSKTGASILANDTHLGLQLPAFWFESQLISPSTNVYGVTFPGAPGIILGFNQKLAWGVTNGTTDVLDWYQVEFKDPNSLEYKFGGEWRKAEFKEERIEQHGGEPESVPVLRTDYGYVMSRNGNLGLAAKWTGHQTSNELKVLLTLDTASSVKECVDALHDWKAPIQNFTCADERNISIYHAGRIPKRISGQGRVVEEASGEKSLWQGEIPFEELPHEINPARGFVFSANERPVGPSYPYYLGWDYEEPFRGQRIRALLTERYKLDGNDFIQIQNDIMNQHAALALPYMLRHLRDTNLGTREKTLREALRQWDFLERAKSIEPSVFEAWWWQIDSLLWHDLKTDERPLYPRKARTIWFFKQWEENKEKYQAWLKPYAGLDDLVTSAYQNAIHDLEENYGDDTSQWLWSAVQKTQLNHVAKFPGFSTEVVMDGGRYSVMANSGNHGPAWKLVVEMGPTPRAWSQFPGGETGNPLDPEYDKFVHAWSRGEMRNVQYWKDSREAVTNAMYVWHWSQR